jgi:hypothetical protein
MEVESSGGNEDLAAASFAACWARASGVIVLPVITIAAPMTAFRMRKARRLMLGGLTGSAGNAGEGESWLLLSVAFIFTSVFVVAV